MNNETIKRLIPDSEAPLRVTQVLADGEVARWDASILAWKVTGDSGFYPNWRTVVMNHGKFSEVIGA